MKLPVQSKIHEVQKHQLCFNCLKLNHQKDCTSRHCRKCSKKHNILLHREESSPDTPVRVNTSTDAATENNEDIKHNVLCNHTREENPVMLATAMVSVQDLWGNQQDCRVLLDAEA